MDIQVAENFYAVLTCISDYWSKDSSGITDVLIEAMKEMDKKDD